MSLGESFDEMRGVDQQVRNAYRAYQAWLEGKSSAKLVEKHQQADLIFRRLGVTFSVYGNEEGTER
ncbi:MAG: circularly permuted type 2 ATP-grasp protein, partial [Rhodospirillales bacterium]|nr:circularly permuted type 2 ATP-grasp protein [Rhodospirillales bacterium]